MYLFHSVHKSSKTFNLCKKRRVIGANQLIWHSAGRMCFVVLQEKSEEPLWMFKKGLLRAVFCVRAAHVYVHFRNLAQCPTPQKKELSHIHNKTYTNLPLTQTSSSLCLKTSMWSSPRNPSLQPCPRATLESWNTDTLLSLRVSFSRALLSTEYSDWSIG